MSSIDAEVRGNVGFLIWRVATRWRAATDRALAPLGLTHAQYSVLAPLYGMSAGGARPSQRELADFTGLDPVYVSKLVRALEREGFVTRSVKAGDPRAVELALTDRGMTAVREGIQAVTRLLEQSLAKAGTTTRPEYLALRVLVARGPWASPGELHGYLAGQRQLGLTEAAVTGLLAGLEDQGLASGTAAGGPGPAEATEAGAALLATLSAAVAPSTRELFAGFDPDELATAHRVLTRVTERAGQLLA